MTGAKPEVNPVAVWTRRRPTPRRQAPGIERIVDAAIDIADREGLEAISMRRIATELETGTASLYRYITGREELLELITDHVQGETTPPFPAGNWRDDLTAVAHHLRDSLLRHPWLASELAGRPALGTNALARHEAGLAAAMELTTNITLADAVLDTVLSYVTGAAAEELAELQARRRSGLTKLQWQHSVAPYLRQVIATGNYPHLARRVVEADEVDPEQRFEFGLTSVLDGVANRVRNSGH